MKLALIAAQSENRVIGKGPDIPWKVKGEQTLFRDITLGGTLIMGRKTWEAIGRSLPGRETIIITRNAGYKADGCQVAGSLEQAMAMAASLGKPTFVAGGGEIYQQAMPHAECLHLTTIHTEVEGDAFFPELPDDFELKSEQFHHSNINYTYRYYERN